MPKQRSESTTRRPPAPSDSHAEIDEWMRGVMPAVQPLIERLDGLIRETIPGLRYAVKWSKAYYGLPEQGWIIELAAYHVSANLVFLGGADFESPPPLGSGRSRYVKLRTLEEAEAPELRRWIEQARGVRGWETEGS